MAKILIKGVLVELTGRVSTRAWTANNGELRSSLNSHSLL
jgi:single-strand DNA-binding protein